MISVEKSVGSLFLVPSTTICSVPAVLLVSRMLHTWDPTYNRPLFLVPVTWESDTTAYWYPLPHYCHSHCVYMSPSVGL